MGEIPPQCQVAAKIDERNRKETYEMTIFTKPFCQIMVAELLTVAAVQIQLPSSNYRLRMLQQHGPFSSMVEQPRHHRGDPGSIPGRCTRNSQET
jgi:hypothetical protein